MIKNPFGSFFFQKIVEIISPKFRIDLLLYLKEIDCINLVCKDHLGNRTIQAFISFSETKEEKKLIAKLLFPYFYDLSFNKFGCFILVKMLSTFNESQNLELISYLNDNLVELILDENGVCLFKSLVDFYTDKDTSFKFEIINKLSSNLKAIFKIKFGHYGLIYLVQKWGTNEIKEIVDFIVHNISLYGILSYSHKFLRKVFFSCDIVSF